MFLVNFIFLFGAEPRESTGINGNQRALVDCDRLSTRISHNNQLLLHLMNLIFVRPFCHGLPPTDSFKGNGEINRKIRKTEQVVDKVCFIIILNKPSEHWCIFFFDYGQHCGHVFLPLIAVDSFGDQRKT
jgi:hypothetical protein